MSVEPEYQEALDRAEESLSDEEETRLYDAIYDLIQERKTFDADDIWEKSGVTEKRGLGPIIQRIAKTGVIKKIGYVPKRSAQGGRWQVTLWESQVFAGGEANLKPETCPHCGQAIPKDSVND